MSSIYGDLLTPVRQHLITVPDLDEDHVKIRKRLVYYKEVDELPLVLICPRAEKLFDYDMTGYAYIDYPVIVAILQESSLLFSSPEYILLKREQIRQKLSKTNMSATAGIYDFQAYNPDPVFDLGGLDAHFDVSVQEFTYRGSGLRQA